jgi:hypothetical protein
MLIALTPISFFCVRLHAAELIFLAQLLEGNFL